MRRNTTVLLAATGVLLIIINVRGVYGQDVAAEQVIDLARAKSFFDEAAYAAKVGGLRASATPVWTGSATRRLPKRAGDEEQKQVPTLTTTGT